MRVPLEEAGDEAEAQRYCEGAGPSAKENRGRNYWKDEMDEAVATRPIPHLKANKEGKKYEDQGRAVTHQKRLRARQ